MIAFVLLGLFLAAILHTLWPAVVGLLLGWAWRAWGGDFLMGVGEGRRCAQAEKVAMAMRCDAQDKMVRENNPVGFYGSDYTQIVTRDSKPPKTVSGVIYPDTVETQPWGAVRGQELPEDGYPTYPRPDWAEVINLDAKDAVR